MEDKKKDKLQLKRLLKDKSYMAFWISTSFSMGASNIIQMVMSLYVLDMTGSATAFASILSITFFPRMFFTPIAGVLGDRMKRLKLMKLSLFVDLAVVLGFAVAASMLETLPIFSIYIIVITLEVIEVFYQASESAILLEIVPKELVNEAVSMSTLDDGIVYVACPSIAALVYKTYGVGGGFWLTAALLLLSFVLKFFIKTPYMVEREKKKINMLSDFKEGMRVIKNHKFLSKYIIAAPIMNLFFSSVFSITIAHLILVNFGLDKSVYGLYRSVTASMMIFVPMIAVPIVKKVSPKRLITNASFIVSACLLLISFVIGAVYLFGRHLIIPSVIMIAVIDCVTIATVVPFMMSSSVLYKTTVDDEHLSRVSSALRMIFMVASPVGNMLFGVLTDTFEPYVNVMIAAAGVFVSHMLFRYAFKGNIVGEHAEN